jgi:hypothetical protein
MTIAGGQ